MWVLCILTFLSVGLHAAEIKLNEQMQELAAQIEMLKTTHLTDLTALKRDIEDLKESSTARVMDNHRRNEQAALQWTRNSVKELQAELKEQSERINNSELLRQMHVIRNELKQALMETSDLAQLARTQEARVDKLDGELGRCRFEGGQMRSSLAVMRKDISRLNKESKAKQLAELNSDVYKGVMSDAGGNIDFKSAHNHRIRHNKMVHAQISRLARSQDQLDEYQQNLQVQILDVQRRLDRFGEPNWNLVSAKVDFLDLESKVFREQLKNITQKISDFDKVHGSLLELREEIEAIENKADKTNPEFRKEISKLDVGFAQLTASASYLKEDQENLRQSVKAIAVSVSNSIDRAEVDRLSLNRLNDTVVDLLSGSKQHFYRLNDHILKSEANPAEVNSTEFDTIPLPELMGEVKELQPVEREYEDLVSQLPTDCSTIDGAPGQYLIHPGRTPVDTWCVNGTTLLQRRYNGSVEFNRNFAEYVKGFGDPASEYWLGLDDQHRLTANNCSSMRIDMTDIYGGYWYASYDHYSVGHADSGYVLEVGGYQGNASDAFEYQNHMKFSTVDRDRDISNTHCAGNYEGGWWYSHCQHVNINGKYNLGLTWFDSVRNEWIAIATSEMRLSRRPDCQ